MREKAILPHDHITNNLLKPSYAGVVTTDGVAKVGEAKAKDILTVPQLMARLVALWPRVFPSAASIEAWAAEYQRALGSLDPARLAQGWEDLMQGWNKAGHPMPADIRQATLNLPEDSKPGRNMKEFFENTQAGSKQLVADWQKRNAPLLQQLRMRHQPADDPRNSQLIRALEQSAKKQAWMLAQQHLAGVNLEQMVEISPQEIEETRLYIDRLFRPDPLAQPPSAVGSAIPVGQPMARLVGSLVGQHHQQADPYPIRNLDNQNL